MSDDTCTRSGCVWELPANTPDNLAAYIVDHHRAYDCPQPATPTPTDNAPHARAAAP